MHFHFPNMILKAGVLRNLEIYPHSWYLRFIAKYTLSGQQFLELRKQHDQMYNQILKDHKKECQKYDDEIERLHDIIRVKDAYLRCINGILVGAVDTFMIF